MQTAPIKPIKPWFRTIAELPEDFSWPWLFGNDHPVEIDIGCGRGLFVVTASEANPDVNYLGLEIDYREGRRAAMRLKRREIPNARIIGGDCRELLAKQVKPGSVHAAHVLFPDPWWKKRHHKRRLFTVEFADLLAVIIEPGGFVHHWTDVKDYFDRVEALMNNHHEFITLPPPEERTPEHDMDYHTSFERKAQERFANLPRFVAAEVSIPGCPESRHWAGRMNGWQLAVLGIRLKLTAVILLAIWSAAVAAVLLTDLSRLKDRDVLLSAAVSIGVIIVVDATGRISCLATPECVGRRVWLVVSVLAQLASIGLLVMPFLLDRDIEVILNILVYALPCLGMQCMAAFLFMGYSRNVAAFIGRPDLESVPRRVLLAYGLAGSSTAGIAIFVALILLLFTCAGCCIGTPIVALLLQGSPPYLLFPLVLGGLSLTYFAFWQYGAFMYRLSKAITTWQQTQAP